MTEVDKLNRSHRYNTTVGKSHDIVKDLLEKKIHNDGKKVRKTDENHVDIDSSTVIL